METRKTKGLEIAKTSRITKTEKGWEVPSQSGHGNYLVQSDGFGALCNCPDYITRNCKCKHIFAVEFIVTQEIDNKGNMTTQVIKKTYAQNWSSYDEASIHQKEIFLKLLSEITNVNNPDYKFGRPTLSMSDMLYASILKVFTTFSLRRFMSDVQIAQEKGYVETKPCYASIGHFMQRKDITSLLSEMVTLTSLPLRNIEKDFAIDSTGFGTSNFQRWFSFKHGKELSSKKWVKCHAMIGTKTNIVTSVKITSEFEHDSPQLKELVEKTSENFDMKEVSCDKGYASRDNHEIIAEHGAVPFIPFKSNVTGKSRGNSLMWKKMYHYFALRNDEFMQHYHKRSNSETSFFMIKSKFGDSVRSKTWNAQVNEVLCKVICHNICCVIQEMHELGVVPNFCVESNPSVYNVRVN